MHALPRKRQRAAKTQPVEMGKSGGTIAQRTVIDSAPDAVRILRRASQGGKPGLRLPPWAARRESLAGTVVSCFRVPPDSGRPGRGPRPTGCAIERWLASALESTTNPPAPPQPPPGAPHTARRTPHFPDSSAAAGAIGTTPMPATRCSSCFQVPAAGCRRPRLSCFQVPRPPAPGHATLPGHWRAGGRHPFAPVWPAPRGRPKRSLPCDPPCPAGQVEAAERAGWPAPRAGSPGHPGPDGQRPHRERQGRAPVAHPGPGDYVGREGGGCTPAKRARRRAAAAR